MQRITPLRAAKWACFVGLVLAAGCLDAPDSSSPGLAVEHGLEGSPIDVRVELSAWTRIEQVIASHAGKVVVIDLWSTTCAPCRREFPHLVDLHERHGDNIACISVSVDYYGDIAEPAESFRPAVTAFLKSQEPAFENFICTDPSDEVLNTLGASAVPTVLVYNRSGGLAKMFEDDGTYGDEGFNYEQHIEPLVEELAAERLSTQTTSASQ